MINEAERVCGGDFRRILFRVLNPNFRKGKRKEERLLLFAVIKVNTLFF